MKQEKRYKTTIQNAASYIFFYARNILIFLRILHLNNIANVTISQDKM